MLEVSRLENGMPGALARPVAPPDIQPPAATAARDRALTPRVDPPAAKPSPTGTSGAPSVDPRAIEQVRVRAILARYETAYSELDANAAAKVYPSMDRKALSRAFSALDSQQILFEDCRIQVGDSALHATATCAGTATWTPKVGGGVRAQARRWQFDLQQVSGEWQIASVRIQ